MKAKEFLERTRELVNGALERWLPPADTEPRRLHEAMRYSVFAGGKRLRPALARAACRAFGGTDEEMMPSACALEMLHTYSLIHDDLPAIDDDDLRRGRPTCHTRFDVATAILAGDALQTHAFFVLAAHTPRRDAIPSLVLELARASGTAGMVGGEIADIEAEGETPDRGRVECIHERKTAALFEASVVMGGLAAGLEEGAPALRSLQEFGTGLGMAFQIVDDVLDLTQDAATLGKSPGKDRKAGKMSYPAAVGVDDSLERAADFAGRARKALEDVPESAILAGLLDFTIERVS
ncbi:MAG: polyprenyl synthetase family protein [Planctomycetota bacterium]